MIDTVNLCLSREDSSSKGENYLDGFPPCLDNVQERVLNDTPCLIGRLRNFEVVAYKQCVKVGNGSLAKFCLGDNLKVMRRQDVERGIEEFSDIFHLDFSKAQVRRLDWAANLDMKQPVAEYLNHLGIPARGWRERYSDTSLYYHGIEGTTFCFYDKIAEMGSEKLSPIWQGKNVLRLEQRYTKRLPDCLKVDRVQATDLYKQEVYYQLTKKFSEDFKKIPIVNNIKIELNKMKSVSDLKRMGTLRFIEDNGGQNAMLAVIDERCKNGELTRKQAFDLRKAILDACKVDDGFVELNEAMVELQAKVKEIARYAR